MFNPTVQLKSGGYIVIGITEALVAVDVNSGRATKEGSIEDTALKTNLEAAEEVARQLRLRDLAGLIVIDFIDMDERRNNLAVEKRLKDKLKTDRARIQVGRISGFGLMEMSRQRLRPGMLESTTQPCAHCHGTGLIRSDDSLGLQVLRALEEEGTRKRSKEVVLRAPIGIVNFLINQKREHIALIESRSGMSVRIECDPAMISPDFTIEKLKVATRVVPENLSVISGNASLMGAPVAEEDYEDEVLDEVVEDEEVTEVAAEPRAAAPAADGGKKRRRRRRRKKPGQSDASGATDDAEEDDTSQEGAEEAPEVVEPEPAPKRGRAPRAGRAKAAAPIVAEAEASSEPAAPADDMPEPVAAPAAKRGRKPKAAAHDPMPEAQPAPAARSRSKAAPPEPTAPSPTAPSPTAPSPTVEEPVASFIEPQVMTPNEPKVEDPTPKPRKKGWWNLGG